MSPTTDTAKTKTATLPIVNKSFLPARADSAKASPVSRWVDDSMTGMIFGPYLVPLACRAD